MAVLLPFQWTGTVLDVKIMVRFCKSVHHHLPENSENYIQRKADPISCKANCKGPAPTIELDGAIRIVQRPKEERNL